MEGDMSHRLKELSQVVHARDNTHKDRQRRDNILQYSITNAHSFIHTHSDTAEQSVMVQS